MLTLWVAMQPQAPPGAAAHVVTGANFFRAGQYEGALVEFKVAQRLGESPEANWYIAATLVKLNRSEDALEEFESAESTAPSHRDALFDYYHALACYEARLYLCADKLLASVGNRSGPSIGAHVGKLRSGMATLLSGEPSQPAIDWYRRKGHAAQSRRRMALARAYFVEAAALAARRRDCYGCTELKTNLAEAQEKKSYRGNH